MFNLALDNPVTYSEVLKFDLGQLISIVWSQPMLYLCQSMYGSHGSPMSLQASVYHFSSHLILGEPHDIPMNCWLLYYIPIYIYTSTHMFDQFYLIYITISRISMYFSWLLLLKPPRCPTKTHTPWLSIYDPLLHGTTAARNPQWSSVTSTSNVHWPCSEIHRNGGLW